MKVLLRKILEKLLLVALCLVLIIGNILLIYNIKNKFVDIEEKFYIIYNINNAKYISVKDIKNNNIIEVNNNEKKELVKKLFNEIKIRESKLDLMDKNQNIDYTVFIIDYSGNESYINFADKEIMVNNEIYETDFSVNLYFEEIFK